MFKTKNMSGSFSYLFLSIPQTGIRGRILEDIRREILAYKWPSEEFGA